MIFWFQIILRKLGILEAESFLAERLQKSGFVSDLTPRFLTTK